MEAFVKLLVRPSTLATRNGLCSNCADACLKFGRLIKPSIARFYSLQAKALPVQPPEESHRKSRSWTECEPDTPEVEVDKTPSGEKKPAKLKRVPRPMTPVISQEQIKKFSTVLSANITGNRFAFCLLNRANPDKDQAFPSLKLDMLELKIFNLKSKMHFLRILNEVKTIVKEVPASHVCVTEEQPNQLRNQHVTNLCLEVTQARAMFIGTLASQVNSPAIVSIKSHALARIFNTFVGREKVSGQFVVQDLMQTEENLKIDDALRTFYQACDSETKEYLSNVFLLNLGYWIITKQYSDRFDLDRLLGNNNSSATAKSGSKKELASRENKAISS